MYFGLYTHPALRWKMDNFIAHVTLNDFACCRQMYLPVFSINTDEMYVHSDISSISVPTLAERHDNTLTTAITIICGTEHTHVYLVSIRRHEQKGCVVT